MMILKDVDTKFDDCVDLKDTWNMYSTVDQVVNSDNCNKFSVFQTQTSDAQTCVKPTGQQAALANFHNM